MDASAEFVYIDLDAQEAPKHTPRSTSFRGLDARQFVDLLAANERLMALPGEASEDAVEIELNAEQLDALLEGRWTP
jgi:hypothetical protein